MIPIHRVGRNQFLKARSYSAPVVVIDSCTFRVPSSQGEGRDHKVRLDDPELPGLVSCTCDAGVHSAPCWAMAKVLLAHQLLLANRIYISRGAASVTSALRNESSAVEPPPRACFVEGEPALLWESHPRANALYRVAG
jgi:hypothetical protein